MNKCRGICAIVLGLMQTLNAYNLPPVNLGASNILDGGPIRPRPGFYWLQYYSHYSSDEFLDGNGNLLGGVRSPRFTADVISTQLVHQSRHRILKGHWGVLIGLPIAFSAKVEPNLLGISSSGGGLGDLRFGGYLQWEPIYRRGRPVFQHRLEFDFVIPSGKNRLPYNNINPGNDIIYINPYWAATFYATEWLALSWRIHYLWCGKNQITDIQAGQAIHLNYSLAAAVTKSKRCWVGVNGYYLRQFQDNRLQGVAIPNSRTQIFAIGPGFAAFLPKKYVIFGYLYSEQKVRNSTRGIKLSLSLVKSF